MKSILLWLWQFPQHILAVLVILFTDAVYSPQHDCYIDINSKTYYGVSLGDYIIFGLGYPGLTTLKHERGHQKQSLMLGWLYLLLIGLPSACGNLLHRIIKFDYYKQPWEAWADRLGGVCR